MNKKTFTWRFFEILPGALSWGALVWPVVFSFFWPSVVAVFILLYNLFWVFRSFYTGYFMILTYRKMRRAMRTDFRRMLESLPKDDPQVAPWKEVYQAVIYATFREELNVLEPSVQSVMDADWPNARKILVLAGEERDKERLERVGEYLKEKYGSKIYGFIISVHPDGIPGELRGKGAGSAWAGKLLTKFAEEKKLSEENLIVHIADADTRFMHQFFNCVCYEFVTNPNRHIRSYQPIPLYSNNIWHAPAMSRLVAWGSSFWQMIETSRPWRLVNFSTHAYSLKMLHGMDYWATDIVNEDSRQFWRAFYAYEGASRAVPIYLPVHMDAVLADNFWTTMKNQYLQKRRWGYGVEHLPYVVTEAIKHKEIPFWDKVVRIFRLVEGDFSLATASFYLTFVGWMPILFSGTFRQTVLAHNYPLVATAVFSLAWVMLLFSVYVSLAFLPPRPSYFKKTKYLELAADWIITPVSALLFGSIPALDAQTRLMLGKYMGFWVTPKSSVSSDPILSAAKQKALKTSD